jgi:hypothetical protein
MLNPRNFAAIAVAAGLFFAADTPRAAENLFLQFSGNWSGSGKIVAQNGSNERIRCRSTNKAEGNSLALALRCASDSYKFELSSDISSDGGNLSGSWNENTRGVFGTLSGKVSGSNIQATASAVGFTAAMSIRSGGGALNVSIRSPGSEISEVSISMAKGGGAPR